MLRKSNFLNKIVYVDSHFDEGDDDHDDHDNDVSLIAVALRSIITL